ncbi:hypothetical protein ACSQ76_11330 [Roseovarius sp. B08]|uniref:hypothetical protein n=1 Tax=Roseovarius sp. B08 TaxID=3449223 RepID=UPI003EDBC38A
MNLYRVPFLICVVLTLSGCLPTNVYYREGAPVSGVERDRTQCDVAALRQVPVRTLTRFIPPTYSYRPICNGAGKCRTVRVLLSPGRWESYDANEGLRARVARQCMADQGYQKVSLKPCPPEVVEATVITATRVQPPLTENSCAIRIKGGKYQIVNPE